MAVKKPGLRLATVEGRRVRSQPRPTRPLTDAQAYDALVQNVEGLRARLSRTSAARRDFGYLLADLEQLRSRLEARAS